MKMPKFSKESVAESFKTRSFRVGGYSIVATVIVIAIAVVVNLLVGALPGEMTQFDLTADKMYSLSEQTKEQIKSLQKDVTVYWIVSGGNEDKYLKSMFDHIEGLSEHLTVVQRDTDVYPTFAGEYTTNTVYGNSFVVECGERHKYMDYNGDVYNFDYADYYTTGGETWYFNGEAALISAIEYVTSEDLPKLYILTGHGESKLSESFAKAVSNQNIETAELSLLTVEKVPEDADGILLCGPSSDISQAELELLQDYLSTGGNLMVLTKPYTEGKRLKNVETLMNDFGMSSVPGTLVETNRNHYYYNFQQALLPQMESHDVTDPLLEAGYRALLSSCHGITVAEDLDADLTVTEILLTSDKAFSKLAGSNMDTYEKEDGDMEGSFATMVLATKSLGEGSESNVAWVGSISLLDDAMNNYVSGGNQDLFLNILSYLCEQEEQNYTIHPKALNDIRYLTMESSTSAMLAIWVIALIPMSYLACGIVIWVRRKRH